MKRKRTDAVKATQDDLPAALAAYGERFLSTFDDYESTAVHTAVGKQPAHPILNQQTSRGSDDSPDERSVVDVLDKGASALDKRAAKAWKAAMLAKLGASADKAPRTPAKIGLGMASKAKQREAAALQEAIAAGMIKAKGRGKKLRAQKEKQREKGLMEAGPGFKNGVLRLRQPR
eukprot:gene12645-12773_t